MRPVVWAHSALEDLRSILGYIAEKNPKAALGVVDQIEAAGNALAELATGRPGRVTGTYELVLPRISYILAYEIREDRAGTEQIVILRAIHGARDWPREAWPED